MFFIRVVTSIAAKSNYNSLQNVDLSPRFDFKRQQLTEAEWWKQ